jgi:hypothetical protein
MIDTAEVEEHQGVLVHQDEWRPGATCGDCQTAYRDRLAALRGQVPNVKIARLQAERESGISSRDIERSVIASARAEGRELARPADYATAHWKKT